MRSAVAGKALIAVALACLAAACTTSEQQGGAARQPFPPSQPPPPLRVLRAAPAASADGRDIFVTPLGGGYPAGPEIVTTTGKVLWFRPLPPGEIATDFRTQTYQGRPVLTWCQGGESASGLVAIDFILNNRYHQIATVRAGAGAATDYHEFLITPQNTALITATRMATANLTALGGSARQRVIDGVVQEIDIKTGKVLFEWDSASHVPYRDSHLPLPASPSIPWDWFHINAVHLDSDGNLLINSRYTWTTYKVNRHTGQVSWELGGRQSTFRLRTAPGQVLDRAGEIFAYQHDPEPIGHGEYTFFDDEADQSRSTKPLLPYSRVVVVRPGLAAKVATLVRSYPQPEHLVTRAQGSAQPLPDGDIFVGWGLQPYLSMFSPSGRLLFNATFPFGVTSYRAYLLPWHPPAPG